MITWWRVRLTRLRVPKRAKSRVYDFAPTETTHGAVQ